MTVSYEATKAELLQAALMHVPFDGWTVSTFEAAIRDTEISRSVARAICPRGAVDLAIAFHKAGDAAMLERLGEADLSGMKFREKVTAAVRFRLEAIEEKEAVRRGATLFALPIYAADGARLVWQTSDAIWTALGDTSEDVNWYTKRATLSGVYSSTVLYWLGDDSPGHMATWAFLDRRIADVMRFEKLKDQVNNNPVMRTLMTGPNWLFGQIKAPISARKSHLPGRWTAARD
ncbi:MAG: COQ9 family protein [Pseudomonadota bacterium]